MQERKYVLSEEKDAQNKKPNVVVLENRDEAILTEMDIGPIQIELDGCTIVDGVYIALTATKTLRALLGIFVP
ncbi:uncharacterized protein Dvir_GJ26929 [Drosophila virilis]|uniref:Uncharacterized protein n=1 Tax=Drosophila virilis TaxID=7244 RepID=A0A0Q9WKM1_DROVI|nr:uncharacterized protein Dvir_GJ26929 [Drosophila virilis]